jgi:hypothetical protein
MQAEGRAFACPVCRRGFRSFANLKRQMAEHTPPRRGGFVASNCGKGSIIGVKNLPAMPEPPEKFLKATETELIAEAQTGVRGQGANIEMMRRLKDSLEKLDASTTRYNKILIALTIAIGILTAAQLLTAFFPSKSPASQLEAVSRAALRVKIFVAIGSYHPRLIL